MQVILLYIIHEGVYICVCPLYRDSTLFCANTPEAQVDTKQGRIEGRRPGIRLVKHKLNTGNAYYNNPMEYGTWVDLELEMHY